MSEFRLTLKHPSGFFAAGCEMRDALTVLSDGAFKIYVYACLHADRRTAQLRFRMAELARATGHSTRSLTVSVRATPHCTRNGIDGSVEGWVKNE